VYAGYELLRGFYDQGLGWSGITKGNIIENVQKTLEKKIKETNKSLIRNYGAEIGDYTETWTRLSQMVDRLNLGLSTEEAANDVRKFHVDYRDLTPIERNLFRRVAPYYTYMRKNFPIQLRTAMTEPGKFAAFGTLINSSYKALGNPETPDYLKENMALPLWTDDDGNTHYLNWGLPLADLSRLKWDLGETFQTNATDMLNPLLKMPLEQGNNTNFSLNQPLEKYEGQTAPLLGFEGSPRIDKNLDYVIQQLGVVDTARRSLGNMVNPANPLKPTGLADKMLLGSLLPTKNATQVQDSNAYQYRDQLQQLIKLLTEEQGQYIPEYQDVEYMQKAQKLDSIKPRVGSGFMINTPYRNYGGR
jgi:hypothetical protein